MSVRRSAEVTIYAKDKISDTLDKIEKKSRKVDDGLTRMSKSVQTVTKNAGNVRKVTTKWTEETKTFSRALKDNTAKIHKWGRRIGFTGFVLQFTLTRIAKSVAKLWKSLGGFITKVGTTDSAIAFLEETITGLALAGKLTGNTVDEVKEKFLDWFWASAELQGAIAELKLALAPFITQVIKSAAEHVGKLSDAFGELIKKHPDLIEKFKGVADALLGPVTDAILNLLSEENFPRFLQMLTDLGAILGEFTAGLIEGNVSLIDLVSNLTEFLPEATKFMRSLGKWTPILIAFGTAATIFGSALGLLSPVLGGIRALMGVGGAAKTVAGLAGTAVTKTALGGGLTSYMAPVAAKTGIATVGPGVTAGGIGAGGLATAAGVGLIAAGPLAALFLASKEQKESWAAEARRQQNLAALVSRQYAAGGQNVTIYSDVSVGTVTGTADLDLVRESVYEGLADGSGKRYSLK